MNRTELVFGMKALRRTSLLKANFCFTLHHTCIYLPDVSEKLDSWLCETLVSADGATAQLVGGDGEPALREFTSPGHFCGTKRNDLGL
jgi:hypothetical protein